MICYDREFPESARILMLVGAELILVPNACNLEQNRLGQFKARAFENMVGLAMANYAAPRCNGHSMAVSPIAFDTQEHLQDVTFSKQMRTKGSELPASIWAQSMTAEVVRHAVMPIESPARTLGSPLWSSATRFATAIPAADQLTCQLFI